MVEKQPKVSIVIATNRDKSYPLKVIKSCLKLDYLILT